MQSFTQCFKQMNANIENNFATFNLQMANETTKVQSQLTTALESRDKAVKEQISQMQNQFQTLIDNMEDRLDTKIQSLPPSSGSKRTRVHSPPQGHSTQETITTASLHLGEISHQLFHSPPSSPSRSLSGSDSDIPMRK